MAKMTETAKQRKFISMPIANKKGQFIGYKTIRRNPPEPAKERTLYICPNRSCGKQFMVSEGQQIVCKHK